MTEPYPTTPPSPISVSPAWTCSAASAPATPRWCSARARRPSRLWPRCRAARGASGPGGPGDPAGRRGDRRLPGANCPTPRSTTSAGSPSWVAGPGERPGGGGRRRYRATCPVMRECAATVRVFGAAAGRHRRRRAWPGCTGCWPSGTASTRPTWSSPWPAWRRRCRRCSAGLVGAPLIAVPTSVGYGWHLDGLTAWLAMLNSCAPGVLTRQRRQRLRRRGRGRPHRPPDRRAGPIESARSGSTPANGAAGDMLLAALLDAGAPPGGGPGRPGRPGRRAARGWSRRRSGGTASARVLAGVTVPCPTSSGTSPTCSRSSRRLPAAGRGVRRGDVRPAGRRGGAGPRHRGRPGPLPRGRRAGRDRRRGRLRAGAGRPRPAGPRYARSRRPVAVGSGRRPHRARAGCRYRRRPCCELLAARRPDRGAPGDDGAVHADRRRAAGHARDRLGAAAGADRRARSASGPGMRDPRRAPERAAGAGRRPRPAARPIGPSPTCHEVEATVDDLDPRIWPDLLDRLRAAGAADAWCTPVLMRKGRPGPGAQRAGRRRPARPGVPARLRADDDARRAGRPVQRRALRRDEVEVTVAGRPVRREAGLPRRAGGDRAAGVRRCVDGVAGDRSARWRTCSVRPRRPRGPRAGRRARRTRDTGARPARCWPGRCVDDGAAQWSDGPHQVEHALGIAAGDLGAPAVGPLARSGPAGPGRPGPRRAARCRTPDGRGTSRPSR